RRVPSFRYVYSAWHSPFKQGYTLGQFYRESRYHPATARHQCMTKLLRILSEVSFTLFQEGLEYLEVHIVIYKRRCLSACVMQLLDKDPLCLAVPLAASLSNRILQGFDVLTHLGQSAFVGELRILFVEVQRTKGNSLRIHCIRLSQFVFTKD